MCLMYIPPSGNANIAANLIKECVHRHLQIKPDAPLLILGNFKHCSLDKTLQGVYQYIKCSTRNNVLDKCYGNIKDELSNSNTKTLSDSIRQMTNMDTERKPLYALNEKERANELNYFYVHFNSDNRGECAAVLENVCTIDCI